jgi:hypothetical protein
VSVLTSCRSLIAFLAVLRVARIGLDGSSSDDNSIMSRDIDARFLSLFVTADWSVDRGAPWLERTGGMADNCTIYSLGHLVISCQYNKKQEPGCQE